jgi:hypothetical protein
LSNGVHDRGSREMVRNAGVLVFEMRSRPIADSNNGVFGDYGTTCCGLRR